LIAGLGRIAEIRPAYTAVRMFDHTPLKIASSIDLWVRDLQGQFYNLEFYVTKMHEQALIGVKACRMLDLLRVNEAKVCAVHTSAERTQSEIQLKAPSCMTKQEVLVEFADVFDGVGRFDGEVHLDTDPTVPPVHMPLRRLPFGVHDKVAEEL
jgi:hypothetical protein